MLNQTHPQGRASTCPPKGGDQRGFKSQCPEQLGSRPRAMKTLCVAEKLVRLRGRGGVECPRCRPPEQGVQGGLAGPRACWPQFRKHASLDEAAHPALNSFSRTDSRVNGGRGEALGAPTMRCLGSEGVCLGLVLPTWPRSRGDT